jgi:integrase
MAVKLTKTVCDRAIYKGKGRASCVIWDSEVKGFCLRISPNGTKAFAINYRTPDGQQRRLTLGKFGILTVDQARQIAKERLLEVAKGFDPAKEKRAYQEALTVAVLCEKYIEHVRGRKRSLDQDIRRMRGRILPALGHRKVISVKRSEVASLHAAIGQQGKSYEANRVLALCSSIFQFAVKSQLVQDNFKNPAEGIEKFHEEKRDIWVTPEELPSLAKAISEESDPNIQKIFWLLLFTGLRKNELLSVRWADIDFSRKTLRIPKTKNRRVHELPLSGAVIEIFGSIPRHAKNEFVFAGEKPGSHRVNIDKVWQRIRAKAGMQNLRIHDLRRSCGSWLAEDGASLLLIGKILNHQTSSTTERYAHLRQDPQREALEKHSAKIVSILDIAKAAQEKKVG